MRLVLSLLACIAITAPANCAPLQGGVEQVEILPVLNLKSLQPKKDERGLSFTQNCSCFNPTQIAKVNLDGRWRIVDGEQWLLDFGSKSEALDQAMQAIKHYGFTELCTLGKNSGGAPQMQYFLANGASASGPALAGEDAIGFDLTRVKAEEIKGSWKVTEGDHWMLDFGKEEETAKHPAEVIQHYGFSNECFVGRPNAPMMYFRK